MNILGINGGLHDSSACVVVDGDLISASSEERHSRIKHDPDFPINAISQCLDRAQLKPDSIDAVAYSWNYFKYEHEKLIYHMKKSIEIAKEDNNLSGINYLETTLERKIKLYKFFNKFEKKAKETFNCNFIPVDHHISHAYSTFPFSGFKDCAILIVDGSGETMTSSIWKRHKGQTNLLKSYYLPHSLGIFYGAITQFLGFMQHDEEWKVMGWAPYGKNLFSDKLSKIINIEKHELNLKYFQCHKGLFPWYTEELTKLLAIKPRDNKSDFSPIYADLAASAQDILESCILKLAKESKELSGLNKLAMAGGVALNGKANGNILKESIFEDLFVTPASADDGSAVGAALWVAEKNGFKVDKNFKTRNIYLGKSYSIKSCSEAVKDSGFEFKEFDLESIQDKVADLLSKGNVIAWFQGSAEFGPRALGNRSILADPRKGFMKDLINSKIKFREPFRPFAPSVMEEYASEYFEGNLNNAIYMNQIFEVNTEKRDLIPAVVHFDGTARVQIVSLNDNPKYHGLLNQFYKKTGIPILVNTSFNVKGEPIVETPFNAINCFKSTGLDFLVIENYILSKNQIP